MAGGFDEEALAEAYNRALTLEKAGEAVEAAAAYRECLALDPDDHGGAAVRLAALGQGETPASAGDAYVATLFDQHADAFEDILVRQLGYGVPALIAERLGEIAPGPYRRMLDLGCGTGLAGEALAERAETIIGVDLSEGMIENCFDKGVYDQLFIGEAVGFLEDFDEEAPFDLVVAADVLPYLGDLDPLLANAAARMAGGGILAFSTETLPDAVFGSRDFMVGPHQRFHHRAAYVTERLGAHGFEVLSCEGIIVRRQEGQPAPGHLVVARRR
ncbi:class I SAM-dependent methyltransferase [Aurantimonas sp. HBX-1]|uniref:class I SAM-dependent DNA methyltransferase n=1 Tax=Aurantimonas sp. HBX-1 TaxID=2906072 RepID=UPI001F38833D|nr:methyltransferase [Aurantimonas sp. HBX-1]UIJ74043.1 methyltransferase domain-containing protein [Aurantimonas sp. HBX-1]